MTLPFPEYDTAADAVWPELDQDEREQVQAVAAAPVGSRAKAAIALGGAYLVYRQFMKTRMARRLKNSDDMSPEELERAARLAYLDFVPVWSYMVVPAVFSSLLIGVEEAGQAIGSDFLRDVARNYSWNLGSYLNRKAITSAKRGYQAQVNRKIDSKKAKDNVVKAFGTTLPGMRSLVGIWTEVEPESTAEHTLTSTKAARVRRVIFGDEKNRAKTIGEEETFSLTSIGKQAAWAHAQQQGLIPMNATRQWITAKDELVCDECGPLHKMEVPIGEPFEVNGKKIWAPSLHPNCRCEVKLKAHLGQEAISHVSRMLTDTKQWTSADDSVDLQSVGKSDNEWETQPRAKSGRFGARPHTKTLDLLDEATVAQDEPDLQAAVNEAQKRELDTVQVAPPERNYSLAKPNQTTGDRSLAGARNYSLANARNYSITPSAEPTPDRSRSISRNMSIARDMSLARSTSLTGKSKNRRLGIGEPEGTPRDTSAGRYVNVGPMYTVFTPDDYASNSNMGGGDHETDTLFQDKFLLSDHDELANTVHAHEQDADDDYIGGVLSEREERYWQQPDGNYVMVDENMLQKSIDYYRNLNHGLRQSEPHFRTWVYDRTWVQTKDGTNPYMARVRPIEVTAADLNLHLSDTVAEHVDESTPVIVQVNYVKDPRHMSSESTLGSVQRDDWSDQGVRITGQNRKGTSTRSVYVKEDNYRFVEEGDLPLRGMNYRVARYAPPM